MSPNESPFSRSIGFSGVVLWFIAIAAVIGVGAAVAAGRYVMAAVLAVFILAAAVVGSRAARAAS